MRLLYFLTFVLVIIKIKFQKKINEIYVLKTHNFNLV